MDKDHAQRYPLEWPAHVARSKWRDRSRFRCKFSQALDHLLNELRLLGAGYPIISTNVALRQDGLPYANQAAPDDPGVAVYFYLDGEQKCIPCDAWDRVRDNMRAIGKTIECLRAIERYGSEQMMNQAFSAFDALPAPDGVVTEQWWDVLGVRSDCSLNEAHKAYLDLAHKHHPDKDDGDHVRMAAINGA